MRFFITGITGFAGSHLADAILDSGHEVFGIAREIRTAPLQRLLRRRARELPARSIRACDLRDGARLRDTLREVKPDGVFHLAGIAFAPRANRDPRTAYEVNLLGSIELLEAVRDAAPGARVVFPTSGEIYGWVEPEELPITETQALRPISAYGVGKAAADLAAFQFFRAHGLDVVRVRPFNHTGPAQSPDFVCSEFARAIVAAELGTGEPRLRVGNLDVDRDFTDVRDTVRAYRALFEKGVAGEAYNVASGRSVSVRSILDRLIAGSARPIAVDVDPAKVRPAEIRRVEVSIEKLIAATGWKAGIPLEETLRDLLSYWREELDA